MAVIKVDLTALEEGTPEHLGKAILAEAKKVLERDDIDIELDGPYFRLKSDDGTVWALRDIPVDGMEMVYRIEAQAAADLNMSLEAVRARTDEILEKEILPFVVADGGYVDMIDIKPFQRDDENYFEVIVELQGACAGCASATMTLKYGIESALREKVHPNIVVSQVGQTIT